jgi:hypothetical protein
MSFSRSLSLAPRSFALESVFICQFHDTKPVDDNIKRVVCAYLKDDSWHAVKDGYYDQNNIVSMNTKGLTPEKTVVHLSNGEKVETIVYKTGKQRGWMIIPNENIADSHR